MGQQVEVLQKLWFCENNWHFRFHSLCLNNGKVRIFHNLLSMVYHFPGKNINTTELISIKHIHYPSLALDTIRLYLPSALSSQRVFLCQALSVCPLVCPSLITAPQPTMIKVSCSCLAEFLVAAWTLLIIGFPYKYFRILWHLKILWIHTDWCFGPAHITHTKIHCNIWKLTGQFVDRLEI